MTYPLRRLIEELEERCSTEMLRDSGCPTWEVWTRWAMEGMTASEAQAAARALGMAPGAIWPDWTAERETEPSRALTLIGDLRRQLGPSC